MSEVLIEIATKFGVPTAVAGFALFWYYKLSQQVINQAISREESHRQDSKERESQMRETIRKFSESVEKMDGTLGTMNTNMFKIGNNLDQNNKILEQLCVDSGLKVINKH